MEANPVTWFKVDDGLHSHPKAMEAGDAMALWVMAGSWCADQLTDGFIPAYMVHRLSVNGAEHARRLVEVGLWEPAEVGGRTGYRFHDWDDMQPSRQVIREVREASRKRVQDYRERKRKERDQASNGVSNAVRNASRNSATTSVTNAARTDTQTPTKPRPDPTTTRSVVGAVARAEVEGVAHETNDSRSDKGDASQPIQRQGLSPVAQAAMADMRATLGRSRPRVDRRPALPDHLLTSEAHVDTDAGTDPPDTGDIREPGRER